MTALHDLYQREGQSPWIDDLKRSYVERGELARLVEEGIRGVTSNPTIMAKAIEEGEDYDEQFASLVEGNGTIDAAYWELVVQDIKGALKILRPTYDACGGADGFVSLEVSPGLAHDTKGTLQAARELHDRIDQPNLLIKIPATPEGLPAIEDMIASGRSVNVTLIFSLERYDAVVDAYLSGLERLVSSGHDPSSVASVASFFVSRVDTEVDRRLDALADASKATAEKAAALKGRAAVAQARLAYERFASHFQSERFARLRAGGAQVQRPLWASTSTKNPNYRDLLYVEELIGPDTVDTMPEATVKAFVDHGKVARTVDRDLDGARQVLEDLASIGIDLDDVTSLLEAEGVASFAKSFDEVLDRLEQKAAALRGR